MESNKSFAEFISLTEQILLISEKAINGTFRFDDQKSLTIMYEKYNNKHEIISAIAENINLDFTVSSALINTLTDISNIYKYQEDKISGINTYEICYNQCNEEKYAYDSQYKAVKQLESERRNNSDSADCAFYGGDTNRYILLMKQDEKIETELIKAREKLNLLETKYNLKKEDIMQYQRNVFNKLSDLCDYYQTIISKYYSKEDSNSTEIIYLNMGVVHAVHQVCNINQFENSSEEKLFDYLNLREAIEASFIKEWERERVCYLISRLYLLVSKDLRKKWRTTILEQLDIKFKSYDSMYSRVGSKTASKKNKDFFEAINKALKVNTNTVDSNL